MKITTKKGEFKELLVRDKTVSIILNENSHMRILSLNNENVKIIAKKNSQVDFYSIYNNNKNIIKEGLCDANAAINWYDAIFNCKEISIKSVLNKPRAKTQQLGFFFLNKLQKFDINAEVIHKSKQTESLIFHRGLLDDDTYVNYRGQIFIGKDCKKCIAHQKSESLLLSSTAKCQARPILEVLNNDVICSHGATMSHIDDEKIFYALSRALDEKTARQLITTGFIQVFIDKFPGKAQEIIFKTLKEKEKWNSQYLIKE
jgi:Fe-S cluster assembly scaffold protein SufB